MRKYYMYILDKRGKKLYIVGVKDSKVINTYDKRDATIFTYADDISFVEEQYEYIRFEPAYPERYKDNERSDTICNIITSIANIVSTIIILIGLIIIIFELI